MWALLGVALCLSRGKESVVEPPSEHYRADWSDRIEEPIIREASGLGGLGLETVPVSAQADFQPGEPAAFESLDAVARGDDDDDDALGALVEADIADKAVEAEMTLLGSECGDAYSTENATLACVNMCLKEATCRTHYDIVQNVMAANVLSLVLNDGTPCPEKGGKCFYAMDDSCLEMSLISRRKTHCYTPAGGVDTGRTKSVYKQERSGKKQQEEPIMARYECEAGACKLVDNSQHTEASCGGKYECTKACLTSNQCLKNIKNKMLLRSGEVDPVTQATFNALSLYCAMATSRNGWKVFGGRQKPRAYCFFRPEERGGGLEGCAGEYCSGSERGSPCAKYCKDGFQCNIHATEKVGQCEKVEERPATLLQ